ncbi:type VI secretion system protein ImpJ [Amorphus orientalis]|uniref:Type VI secretion system protein ImpJ n=2 Tax=Amorphus orientalis TaxID=649198 RepID=A0AAE3VLL4_9HYPH|nr:type VI secretion system protein ImpJ [Amorphus orientalis]
MSPQHFQQHDRWLDRLVDERASGLSPAAWGVRAISVDQNALALGRFVLTNLRAVLPDGTVVRAPEDAALPEPKAISTNDGGSLVKLVLPLRPGDGVELSRNQEYRRVLTSEIEARDATNPDRSAVRVTVGQPNIRIAVGNKPVEDCCELPIARIKSVEPSGAVELDTDFMGPALDIHAFPAMLDAARETHRLLNQRAMVLAERSGPTQSDTDTAGLMDIILLSCVNRQEVLFQHYSQTAGVHPEALYRAMIGVVGELSAFLGQTRRPEELPAYVHAKPEEVFPPLVLRVQELLATVTERKAIRIPIEPKAYGIWIGQITDRSIFTGCRLILVATASMPTEVISREFPVRTKVGPVEQIRDLVNLQLPGIPLRQVNVVPRELPVLRNGVYFELDQSAELWPRLQNSAAFAFHVSGDHPDLYMEFWAVRTS